MAYQSPYARGDQSQDPRRFSIPRGIKSMLRSLKGGSGPHIGSNKVSVGDPGASSGSDNRPQRAHLPAAGQASSHAPRKPSGSRVRSDSTGSTPPSSGRAHERAPAGAAAARHSRLSIRELIGGHDGKEGGSGTVSQPHVRQIEVKPPPDAAATKKTICDKCDGKHETSNCPYYKKEREKHPDAQKGNKRLGGMSKLPGATIRSARVVRQPGDGSCLFHSLSFGLKDGSSASTLRRKICAFIVDNPKLKIADTPLSDWVKWDSRSSVSQYARKMSGGAWGGGIEMAAVSKMKGVNVHVYEQCGGTFKRISAFDHEDCPETKPVVRVLYGGGVHYDALVA